MRQGSHFLAYRWEYKGIVTKYWNKTLAIPEWKRIRQAPHGGLDWLLVRPAPTLTKHCHNRPPYQVKRPVIHRRCVVSHDVSLQAS